MSTATAMPSFETTANSNEGGDFELPPSGIHPAVLVGLIDLGTHTSTYGGKTSERHKILLVWELTHEADSQGRNFVVAQDYTWSLNTKAQLRKIVEGFLGRSLQDSEKYDLMKMVGSPCMVNLSEGLSGSGKKFIEVASVSQPMKGLTVNAASNQPFAFHLGAVNSALDELGVPGWVPKLYGRNVADDIRASREFQALPNF